MIRLATATLSVLTVCTAGVSPIFAAPGPPAPLLLLFPHTSGDAADARALIALRTRLRHDGRLEVISFDPDAPAVILAASENNHPEWLTNPIMTDAARQQIGRAVGAADVGVVSDAGHGKVTISLLTAGSPIRTWSISRLSPAAAVAAVEGDILAPPVPLSGRTDQRAGASPAAPVVSPGPTASPVHPPAPSPAHPAPAPAASVPVIPAPPAPAAATPVIPSPSAPLPAPSPSPKPIITAPTSAGDLTAIQPLISQADQDVANDDVVDAYALYRRAINLDPLSDVPRLKLAQAYLKGGLPDMALSEARRALEVSPHSAAIQEFLAAYDAQTGTAQGTVASAQALADENPQDPAAHLDFGKALWNAGQDAQAVTEYQKARDLASSDTLVRQRAVAHLAALHAALGDYSASLKEMKEAGDLSYPLVLSVVQNAADSLTTTMDQAQSDYDAGKITRAALYHKIQQEETRAQSLADFAGKITPPQPYQTSQLDRVQALNLIAQAAAVLIGYLETNDSAQHDKAVLLEQDAQAEMLTAHAAEEKLGLWNAETQVGEGGNE